MNRFTIRPYVCALLVLCLCAAMVPNAAPVVSRDRASEFRALAAPPSLVLQIRADGRQYSTRRQSMPFLLIPVPLRRGAPDLVRLMAAPNRRAPLYLFTAGTRTGRSPPAIS